MQWVVLSGDARKILARVPEKSVQMCMTSPPYFGLRSYDCPDLLWRGDPACSHSKWVPFIKPGISGGTGKASRKREYSRGKSKGEDNPNFQIVPDQEQAYCENCGCWSGQLGQEPTLEMYVDHLVDVYRAVHRVLKDDGTFWLNIADTWAGSGRGLNGDGTHGKTTEKQASNKGVLVRGIGPSPIPDSMKAKDVMNVPGLVGDALRTDGWYWRSKIIWHKCLAGTMPLYYRSHGRPVRGSVRDLERLPVEFLELPGTDGSWRKVLKVTPQGSSQTRTIHLRNGSKWEATLNHRFPTERGVVPVSDLVVGDTLVEATLPDEKGTPLGTYDVGWVVGFYMAEGSEETDNRTGMRFSIHAKEDLYADRLRAFSSQFAGDYREHTYGNCKAVILSGLAVKGVIQNYTENRGAKKKHLSRRCWEESNRFLEGVMDGYLDGDGGYDSTNNRWRLGFTWNYELMNDLRTACCRLGWTLRAKGGRTYDGTGKVHAVVRGEIRKIRSDHWNNKSNVEIVRIEPTSAPTFEVEIDGDHLFVLPDGVVTHNSNAFPEGGVYDRPFKSYEYVLLFSKKSHYFYDRSAVTEEAKDGGGKFLRDVWSINNETSTLPHFASFPTALAERCVLLGSKPGDIVLDPMCGIGRSVVAAVRNGRKAIGIDLGESYVEMARVYVSKKTGVD